MQIAYDSSVKVEIYKILQNILFKAMPNQTQKLSIRLNDCKHSYTLLSVKPNRTFITKHSKECDKHKNIRRKTKKEFIDRFDLAFFAFVVVVRKMDNQKKGKVVQCDFTINFAKSKMHPSRPSTISDKSNK